MPLARCPYNAHKTPIKRSTNSGCLEACCTRRILEFGAVVATLDRFGLEERFAKRISDAVDAVDVLLLDEDQERALIYSVVVATVGNRAAHDLPTAAFENAMRFHRAFQADRANDQRAQHEQG